jgi:fatty acid desaturase
VALLFPYSGLCVLAWTAERVDSWGLRLALLPLFAAMQNHLQILMHEGAHYQILPQKRAGDFLTNVTCALPFFGFLSHYRYFHFAHHRHLRNPELDPEVAFYAEQGYAFKPMPAGRLAWMLFLDLSGYHFFQFLFSYQRFVFGEIRARRLPAIAGDEWMAASVVTVFFAFVLLLPHGGRIFAAYWLLPQATFLFFFLKLQGYGEHRARGATIEASTFGHDRGCLVRFFIYPLNSDRHLVHHLYPNVPWYRLRKIGSSPKRGYFFGQESILKTQLLENRRGIS